VRGGLIRSDAFSDVPMSQISWTIIISTRETGSYRRAADATNNPSPQSGGTLSPLGLLLLLAPQYLQCTLTTDFIVIIIKRYLQRNTVVTLEALCRRLSTATINRLPLYEIPLHLLLFFCCCSEMINDDFHLNQLLLVNSNYITLQLIRQDISFRCSWNYSRRTSMLNDAFYLAQ